MSTQPFPGSKQELLDAMLTAFSESVFLYDTYQKRIIFTSQRLLTILGYPQGTVTSNEIIDEWLHPDERQAVRLLSVKVLKGETSVGSMAIRIKHFDGSYRWFSLRQVIFDRSSGARPQYLFGVLVDIHTRKEADIRIRRQNEAIQQYTFTASHVIRAPLANILGLIGLLRNLPDGDAEERTALLALLQESAVTLDTIITDLILHISRRK